jgi:hypothetical protein
VTANDEKPTKADAADPPIDPPIDPLEPVADDSVLADTPDTSTGKEQLLEDDEGRPGPGV